MDTDELILKFIQRRKRYRMANTKLKKNKIWMLPDFKTYYKVTVIKMMVVAKG